MAKVEEKTDKKAGAPPAVEHFTAEERAARGRVARSDCPRASHSTLGFADDRDPVAILEAQAPSRVPELVPIRYGRMLVSAFTFYRGAAAIMAHDLNSTPRAGLQVQLCGDAHLANFGGYGSPERSLVFDLNDFDETLPGPFEWDVKRLATSFEIAGRDRRFSEAQRDASVLGVVRAYREAMRQFAGMNNLELWYSRLDAVALEEQMRARNETKQADKMKVTVEKARTKDSMKAFSKLTREVDGEPRIIRDPPLIVTLEDLAAERAEAITAELQATYRSYRRTLQRDRRHLLEQFRWVDLARKVVGVGSVGTRCFDPAAARPRRKRPAVPPDQGGAGIGARAVSRQERVREPRPARASKGSALMQAVSDIFLGWVHVGADTTLDQTPRDFYFRQLWDWKTSTDLDVITAKGLELYATVCGWTLARAHARSGDRIAIAEYLGKGDVFDIALAEFSRAYADQNDKDHAALRQAADDGSIKIEEGL